MDLFWREVIEHIAAKSPDARYAAPNPFENSLNNVIPYPEIVNFDLDKFDGIVIHKSLYDQIDATFLYQMFERSVPTFANPVFIILEVNGTRLPSRDQHLGLLPKIKDWATVNADPTIRRSGKINKMSRNSGESKDDILTPMVNFIVEHLAKVIEPTQSDPIIAVAETAERFNDTAWFWVDDTAKTAELFAVPKIRNAHPALANAMLDYVLRLSPDFIIHRRAATPELKLVNADPTNFRAYNSFFNLTGNLTRGVICPSVRYNDDRTREIVQYSGNVIRFRYRGRRQAIDIENSIKTWAIVEHHDKIIFSHTSVIHGRPFIGAGTHVCDVTYSYTLWSVRPTVEVSVSLTITRGVTIEDVQISTAFDQLSPERGFKTTIVGYGDNFESHTAQEKESKNTLHTGPADYLCFYESSWIPGFAHGIHTHFKDSNRLEDIIEEGSTQENYHWVYARYRLGALQNGETESITEDRLLTGGGYYNRPEIYRNLLIAVENMAGNIDPSVSYDVGAELNAVAVTILFAKKGLYSVSPPSEERLQSLKIWYDRHINTYLEIVQPRETGDLQRIFTRGLSFVILSLDCMARAYHQDDRYKSMLQTCVHLMLQLEKPVLKGQEESLFGPPELDCQVSALLALARATYWGDTDQKISSAIRRALRAISVSCAYSDPGGQESFLYDSLLVRNEVGGTNQDTGFWNFKLGLALRAFNAVRQMQEAGFIFLDQHTLTHLGLLNTFARLALTPSMREEDGTIEVLTSQKSGETNSETQPWVALGLCPAIEWEILGKPLTATPDIVQSYVYNSLPPDPVVSYFDQAAPPMHVEWDCTEPQITSLFLRVAKIWKDLGENKPHWSVMSNDQYLPSNIESSKNDFFATGEHDRQRLLATIRRIGMNPIDFKVVHEFGCGVGRVTKYLSESFEQIIACDVSLPHIDLARARCLWVNRNNIEYRLASLPTFGMEEPFDLWYSIIVLQHNPPPIIAMILQRALKMLRPGGLAIFQIPTYSPTYHFKINDYLESAVPSLGIEMHFLPQAALFKIVSKANCTLLEITNDGITGGKDSLSNFVVILKNDTRE